MNNIAFFFQQLLGTIIVSTLTSTGFDANQSLLKKLNRENDVLNVRSTYQTYRWETENFQRFCFVIRIISIGNIVVPIIVSSQNIHYALTKLSFEHFLEWNDVSRKVMIKETKPFKNEIMISS